MAITRIKNNQITDSTITNAKIVPGTITGGSLNSNLSYNGNLTVTGNLSVSGTTTVVDTVNTTIADPLLVLSRNASGSASVDAGLIIERGDDTNVAFVWDESSDEFAVATTTEDGTTSGDVTISAYANVKIATAKMDTLADQAGTASPKIAGLTATRVTFGGTDGILTDDSGFTFASDTLTIGNVDIGTNTVETSSGNLTITGAGGGVTTGSDVTVTSSTASSSSSTGALVVTGGVGIGDDLNVGGDTDLTGNLTVGGTLDLTGDLSAGNLTLSGDIDASTGTIDTLDGTDASFGGNLTVTGTSTFTGDMGAGNIVASGDIDASTGTIDTLDGTDASFGGNLTVTGTSTFTGDMGAGNIVASGDIDAATGTIDTLDGTDASFGGNLTVTGTADVTGNLTAGNISTTTAVITTGNITTVNSTTENVGTINVSTLANVQASTASTSNTTGAVIVAGGVGVGGNLHVGGDTVDFDGNLAVGGDVVISGNLSVDGTATYVNTTTTTVADPIMVIGGGDDGAAPTVDDNKDRGVLFQWHNGSGAKAGFFGFDDSTGRFTFVPDATNSSEVISGSVGDVEINDLYAANGTFSGNLSADNLDLDGITVVDLGVTGNVTVDGTSTFTGNVGAGNIIASGDIEAATGTITTLDGTDASFGGNLTVTGESTFTGDVGAGNISASGTADVTGNLTAGNISTTTAVITTGNITTINAVDGTFGGNIGALGNISATEQLSGNTLTISTTADVTGNLTAGNISTTTAVITTGNITTINSDDINVGNISVTTLANIADANITDTTASTTTTTGALKVAGGTGIAGNINVGGAKSTFTDTTASTSTSSGVVVISGGVGIAGNAFVGNLAITGSTVISSTTNGPINFAPNGTGSIVLNSSGLNNDTVIKGETDDNLIYVDASADNVGIGTGTPNAGAKLHISSTDSMIIPNGTTAERPGTGATAMVRFNTDTSFVEYYNGSEWVALASEFTIIASQNYNGDGSTVAFTLSEAQTTASCIVSINGVIQLPGTAYSVSGTTLTFTEAPGSTDVIEVRKLTTTQTVTNLADDINGYAAVFATTDGIEMYTGAAARTKYVTVDNNGQVRVIATTASTSLSTGALVVEGGAAINGNVWMDGHLIPGSDETYDLGSASNKWGALYLAGATITLGNVVIKDNGGQVAFYEADGTTPTTIDSNNVDTTTIANGTSSLAVIASGGNIRANVAGSTVTTVHSGGLNITGATTSSGTLTAGNLSTGGTLGVTGLATLSGGADITGSVDISQDLVVEGNLTVNGDTTTISATNLAVEDNFIYLNDGSTVTNPDLGIAGNYNDGTYRHAGIFRDATDGKFKVFDQYTPEPGAEINVGHASYNAADFVAGAIEVVDTTASTSTTTGALKVSGGAGVAGQLYVGGATNKFTAATASTSTTTGAVVVSGGVGVAGNVYVGGTMYGTATSAKYADLAENYVGDASYEPGTVVEFGGDAEVTACIHDMCTRVAGVVSTNPAYLMNNELEAEHVIAVAFTGRVPCKVVGPVRKGDMMVSAGNGAARAEENPKVGSIIGKALENFDGAEGVIEVVVGRF